MKTHTAANRRPRSEALKQSMEELSVDVGDQHKEGIER
jgi:hypothetical protein